MRLKSAEEIDAIGRAGEIVAGVLALVGERAEPGVSTKDLDALAECLQLGSVTHSPVDGAYANRAGEGAQLGVDLLAAVAHLLSRRCPLLAQDS